MIDLSNYRPRLDRGSSVMKEALWVLFKTLFFLPNYPLPSCVRVQLLRLFGAKLGRRVVIRAGVNVTFPWKLVVGDDVWVGEDVLVLNLATVRIGSNVCISQRAFLCTGSHKFEEKQFDLVTREIAIEDGCWIAANSFVCPGVSFRSGSMCAAGSVVTRDVDAKTIVGGNPARVIKSF